MTMREIREIYAAEMDDFGQISANAYPGADVQTAETRQRFQLRMAEAADRGEMRLLALYEAAEMRGVMRWYDFRMNLFGQEVLAGGIGGVAVDLAHKKRGIATDMLRAFLAHYHEAGAALAALYPFRPDFYRHMGFGYGPPLYGYRFRPSSLPRARGGIHARFLGPEDQQGMVACYDRYAARTHGMMARGPFIWELRFQDGANHFVGVPGEGGLEGYLIFRFEKGDVDHFLSNKIFVRELVYESPAALQALLGFLNTQADQIEEIVYNAFDPLFFYALRDPRAPVGDLLPHVVYHESSTQGLGLMYRLLDIPRFFELLVDHDFGGQTLALAIDLEDGFFAQNAGRTTVTFAEGKPAVAAVAQPDVTMSMDVADFSSLALGCVGARTLFDLGLLRLSDERFLPQVARLFSAAPPICLTSF